jgi:hypothetical protein
MAMPYPKITPVKLAPDPKKAIKVKTPNKTAWVAPRKAKPDKSGVKLTILENNYLSTLLHNFVPPLLK